MLKIHTHLQPNGWLQTVEHLRQVDSTNSHARRLLSDNPSLPLPALIVADRQTAGRGRLDRTWHAPGKALTASLAVLNDDPMLGFGVAVAVADAIDRLAGGTRLTQLKWPNDIYLGHRKAGGILIERVSIAGRGRVSIIGIGLNIDAAPQLADPAAAAATCLADHLTPPPQTEDVLSAIVRELETQLQSPDRDWPGAFRQRCSLTGQSVVVRQNGGSIQGVCCGIADDGTLRVATEAGVIACAAGEVHRVRSASGIAALD